MLQNEYLWSEGLNCLFHGQAYNFLNDPRNIKDQLKIYPYGAPPGWLSGERVALVTWWL